MAATGDDVRGITGSSLGDSVLDPFICAASVMIDNISLCLSAKGVVDTNQIEAWLASHLLSISGVGDGVTSKTEVSFENYSVKYARAQIRKEGLMSTPYGQTANALSKGCLADLDKDVSQICFFG